jgi:hypothetical protein
MERNPGPGRVGVAAVVRREIAAIGRKSGDPQAPLGQHAGAQQRTRSQPMNARFKNPSTASLLTGIALVTAGALLTRQPVGLLHTVDIAHGWPLFVIVLAFVQMIATINELHQQGWGLLLAGDWLLANTMTDWAYVQISVPVLLAGLGLMTIIRGLHDQSRNSDQDYRATQ